MKIISKIIWQLIALCTIFLIVITLLATILSAFNIYINEFVTKEETVLTDILNLNFYEILSLLLGAFLFTFIGIVITSLLFLIILKSFNKQMTAKQAAFIVKGWSIVFIFLFLTTAFNQSMFSLLATLFSFLVLCKEWLFPKINQSYDLKE